MIATPTLPPVLETETTPLPGESAVDFSLRMARVQEALRGPIGPEEPEDTPLGKFGRVWGS